MRSMTMARVGHLFSLSSRGYAFTVSGELFWAFPGKSGVVGRQDVPGNASLLPRIKGLSPRAFTPHTDLCLWLPTSSCFLKSCTKTPAYCGLGFASRYLSHEFEFTLSYPV